MIFAALLQPLNVREQDALLFVQVEEDLIGQLCQIALDECGFRMRGTMLGCHALSHRLQVRQLAADVGMMPLNDVPDELIGCGPAQVFRGSRFPRRLRQCGQYFAGGNIFFCTGLAQRPIAAATIIQVKAFKDGNGGRLLQSD